MAQPMRVLTILELKARRAALRSGSVTVMTEMRAQREFRCARWSRINQTITQPMKMRTAYCKPEGVADAAMGDWLVADMAVLSGW